MAVRPGDNGSGLRTVERVRARLLNTPGLLVAALVLFGGAEALLRVLSGGAPAMLDLTPLRDGVPLLLGTDDGVAEAPLFHGALWCLTWVFGMGAGTWLAVSGSVLLAVAGVGSMVRSRVGATMAGVVFIGTPFALTRMHHGQVAFLASVGVALLGCNAVRLERWVRGAALWACAVAIAPHVLLIGAPLLWFMKLGWRRTVVLLMPAAIAAAPLLTASSMLPERGALEESLSRFAPKFGEMPGALFKAVTQQGFWAGDVAPFSALLVCAFAFLVAVSLTITRRWWALVAVVLAPIAASGLAWVLGGVIPVLPVLVLLREPQKLLVIAAVALAWGVASWVETRSRNVQAVLLCAAAVLGVLGVRAAWEGTVLSSSTVSALDAVRATVGDDPVVVVPAQRYPYVNDVRTEVQDPVERWLGGWRLRHLSAWDETHAAQERRVREYVASGGADRAALVESGARWVVALRSERDGMSWLSDSENLKRRISGDVELYEVLDPSACAGACSQLREADAGGWRWVLLMASFAAGPGLLAASVFARRRTEEFAYESELSAG